MKKDLDEIDTDIVTLSSFILQEQRRYNQKHKNEEGKPCIIQEASGELSLLLNSLQFSFKFIANTIRKAELVNLIGLSGIVNSTGDEQKKLDKICNDIFITAMKSNGCCKLIVSEEEEDLIVVDSNGSYAVTCDPIDGSSNIDAGVSVGTIFGIYKLRPGSQGDISDVLRPGKEMVAAGYTMYGASAHLLLTTGHRVNGFTLDTDIGEFILTHRNMKMPLQHSIYSINEGYTAFWDEKIARFIAHLKESTPDKKPYSARYIGSMVADMHRTILYGGLFAYPCSKGNNGKLRLLYECFPMAFLVEQAGGIAVNDKGDRILDLVPKTLHGKSSIWLGSKHEVEEYINFIK
ncbi:Fructose-1,6-bisphosphatase [Schizosaccharomyces pombe]|uniref:Fructose-1,6-bisphosphatase n=1 Tax=Schizosaccharomyces pombe (strain 972 / ATCC 24843) TaxID=284812 RepID=F16P_SCHPO|nr:fructose-1,6-bisphosphatase Fbp1 [Schizosaccharomyces pombe]P09202.1 RecName: Full=Fructose-1,6-bisphosphatase; Short=FBPase; AltName: Full=D-fructose-1,6-bisphosphate 1-phosphohydrolase [Schizosaccharomyces pombe 972h-]AAA35304.1 fructose-1,6-bisphosphatase [Schizosaccharomyces pombe]CAB91189.2 fructose-1,6-bisphosphatase Fbp1 [Schizosaccharomyces pombe]|eukprot:NP_595083.2 fructose-1,6-bisphosphatase Fbp1 [Schizosaccharomyces pombe]